MRRRRNKQVEENFWPSFTDMISTIALILFFLMLIAFINNIITGKNLEYAKQQLIDTELSLEESKAEISHAENQLRLLKDDLDKTMAELEIGEIALKLSEEEIETQREIIADSNLELGELRSKLEGIAVLRLELLKSVKASIEENLGAKTAEGEDLVSIADNGNIVINESLVFEFNSYTIKAEGRDLLDKLAEAFENVLDDAEVRASIDAISIQGHTDERGTAEYNRELSAKRAYTVVNYLLNTNTKLETKYGEYFTASAYSEFRPLSEGTTEADYSMNRRIEISVILKDSNVQKIIDEYLEDSLTIFND
ncbi:MAG: OmpA family protein [Clostridiales bacterium]|nr:OmpA family protein [Clostridiales bacterium]